MKVGIWIQLDTSSFRNFELKIYQLSEYRDDCFSLRRIAIRGENTAFKANHSLRGRDCIPQGQDFIVFWVLTIQLIGL